MHKTIIISSVHRESTPREVSQQSKHTQQNRPT